MKKSANTLRVTDGLRNGLLLLMCFAVCAQEKPKWGSITDVRIENQGTVTRVSVLANGLIDIKADRIENPARIFVDFADMVPQLAGRTDNGPRGAMQAIAATGNLLKQVRVAENHKGVTRLVFDLQLGEVEYRTVVLKDPNRLVVELRPLKADPKLKNPLGTSPPIFSTMIPEKMAPRKVNVELPGRRSIVRSSFVMPEPPLLLSSFKLPKADPTQMPYRVSGFIMRDMRLPPPANAVSRQAVQSQATAVAASRTGAGRQSLTRVLGLKIGKVVIDPGHGGHDPGSTGATGLVEKDVTLDVAKRLAVLLETNLGSEVVLTRKDDVYISPEQRTEIANQHHADLFISIHVNSSQLRTATGVETYYLNFTSSPEALEVAARENASSERSVADLGSLIKKIALKDKIDESREFAGRLQQSLFAGSTKAGNRTKDRGVRKAPLIVLIGAEMPSVLTEIGFLSNPKEEAMLKKPDYRQKIAEALLRGVAQYMDTLSHFSVAQLGN